MLILVRVFLVLLNVLIVIMQLAVWYVLILHHYLDKIYLNNVHVLMVMLKLWQEEAVSVVLLNVTLVQLKLIFVQHAPCLMIQQKWQIGMVQIC